MSKKIVVIGGGPAGIEAARAAAQAGAAVTLISNGPVGGRAGWHSLLPSKVWLTAADALGLLGAGDELGVTAVSPTPDSSRILARIKAVKTAWNEQQAAALTELDVTVLAATAVFQSPTRLLLKVDEDDPGTTLTADSFIVAPGSVPIFPPAMRPNGRNILAPRFASGLETVPESIVVVGGGATGCEFVYLFQRLGTAVTWVVDQFGVLPGFDPAAGELLADVLVNRGVTLVAGQMATDIEETGAGVAVMLANGRRQEADAAFLAIGRRPDVAGLGLEAAGLAPEKGMVAVDAYGRSAQAHIYLAGDVTGPPMTANKGTAQGWVAGRHATGAPVNPFRPETVIAAIYTEPQVAQVGQVIGPGMETVRFPFTAGLKSHLLPDSEGFVQLTVGENGRIAGAVAVGDHAADVLAPVAVAIQAGMTATMFASLYAAHPTMSELAFMAARQVVGDGG